MPDRPRLSVFQLIQLVFLGAIAFSTGGILMWLLLSNNSKPADNPLLRGSAAQNVAPSQSGGTMSTASPGFDAVKEHQLAQAPNIAGMNPQAAALTLANWSFDQKAWSEAISQYQKAIALGADNPDVRTDLGSAYRFSGQYDKAIEQYEIATRQNPHHENSLFNLASLYLQNLRQPAKAIELLEEFERKFPQSGALSRAQGLLAEAQRELGSSGVQKKEDSELQNSKTP